jgi:predicted anti-sigma-YlaC factor YlaD
MPVKDVSQFEIRLRSRLRELNVRLSGVEAELDQPANADAEERATEREGDEVLESLGNSGLLEIRMIQSIPTGTRRPVTGARILLALAVIAVAAGCSPRKVAVGVIGDALAGGGGVYASDPDPELIREALPFALKTYEGLLVASPEHRGLLLAAARGFTAYAFMLSDEADRLDDPARARAQRQRAKGLYLRGRDHALRGLDVSHSGFTAALRSAEGDPLAGTTPGDADFLYWAGAAWAGALAADKQDFMLMAELRFAGQLVQRVVELDDAYDGGSAHQFLVSYEGARPGGSLDTARAHYSRALELSGGGRAGLHLALAEAVAVPEQDLAAFRGLIEAALAVDLDADPDQRVANTLAQRRARWLAAEIPELFFEVSEAGGLNSVGG